MELQNDTKIFVDSNFFICLGNPIEPSFEKAHEIMRVLESSDAKIFISNFIFLEVVTVLAQRQNKPAAIAAGKELQSNPRITMVMIDPELQAASWGIFQEIPKKNMSFVDCSVLAIMRAEHITSLLTFDRTDFSTFRKRFHFKFYGE